MDLTSLADEALLLGLKALVGTEREDTAQVIRHLMEVERRDLHLKRAFPSLYAYCIRELGYSEAAAYYRIRAARAANRFPEILTMLEAGETHLEAIVRLHPHLELDSGAQLLEAAKGKSKRQVEALVADLEPQPEKPDFIRTITIAPSPEPAEPGDTLFASQAAAPPRADAPRRMVEFKFYADEELLTLLQRAQELMRHKYPRGRLEDIFSDALQALLDKRDPDRRLLVKLPKRARLD